MGRPNGNRVAAALTRVPFSRATANQLDAGMMRADGTVLPCALSIGLLGGTHRDLQVVMSTNLSLAMESLDDAEVATNDTAAHRPLREDLAEVTGAVDRATALTSRLLDLARRQQGEDDQTDVAELVGALRGLVARTLPSGIALVVDVPEDLPLVACDPVQLERAVLNLIDNARDAVGDGGTITVHAEEHLVSAVGHERRSNLADEPLRGAVRREVSDDGTRLIDAARRVNPDLPVVVLASVEATRALEWDPVLVKPFSQLRLLRTVGRVLAGR